MKTHTIVGLAIFVAANGCVLRANLLMGDIVAEINRLLPKEREIRVDGFVRSKFFDILAEYRRLYPGGRLLSRFYAWSVVGLAVWLACAGCLLFWTGANFSLSRH